MDTTCNHHLVIEHIKAHAPCTIQDIQKAHPHRPSIGSAVSQVWSRLGNTHKHAANIMERLKIGRRHIYQKLDVDVATAVAAYERVTKKQNHNPVKLTKPTPPKPKPAADDSTNTRMDKAIQDAAAAVAGELVNVKWTATAYYGNGG